MFICFLLFIFYWIKRILMWPWIWLGCNPAFLLIPIQAFHLPFLCNWSCLSINVRFNILMDWLCCTMTRSMKEFRQKKRHEWVEELNERVDVPECDVSVWFRIIHPHSWPRQGPVHLYIISPVCFSFSFFNSHCWIAETKQKSVQSNQSKQKFALMSSGTC